GTLKLLTKEYINGILIKKIGDYKMPKRITHEDFLKQVEEKYGDRFIVLEKYRAANKKIQIKCRECGDIKNVTPASFIRQKIGCKKCYHNSRIITFKEEQKRISEMTNNEY